jgi:sugar/nucleoside kinase (ribokinase family)
MCTFLGAGSLIGPEDIHKEQIINHKIAYLEGYLWDNENAKKAMRKMVDICKADNQQIAFTLSDLFCVDRHRDSFAELIKSNIDILFGNEEEICAMTNSTSIEQGIAYAKELNITAAITLAERGSLIIKNNQVIEVPAIDIDKVVDTTGAGDLFASGFLYGLCQNKELAECGHMASVAAAEIISHYGARPLVKLSNLV